MSRPIGGHRAVLGHGGRSAGDNDSSRPPTVTRESPPRQVASAMAGESGQFGLELADAGRHDVHELVDLRRG